MELVTNGSVINIKNGTEEKKIDIINKNLIRIYKNQSSVVVMPHTLQRYQEVEK